MIRFVKALILFPVVVIVLLLAVANRGPVTVSLDPFSQETPEVAFSVPLFALIFLAVMLGIIIGGVGAWLAQGKHRRAERLYKREARRLRADTVRARPASGSTDLAAFPGSAPSRF